MDGIAEWYYLITYYSLFSVLFQMDNQKVYNHNFEEIRHERAMLPAIDVEGKGYFDRIKTVTDIVQKDIIDTSAE